MQLSQSEYLKTAYLILVPDISRAYRVAEKFLEGDFEPASVYDLVGYKGFYKFRRIYVLCDSKNLRLGGSYLFNLFEDERYNFDLIIKTDLCLSCRKCMNLCGSLCLVDKVYQVNSFSDLNNFDNEVHSASVNPFFRDIAFFVSEQRKQKILPVVSYSLSSILDRKSIVNSEMFEVLDMGSYDLYSHVSRSLSFVLPIYSSECSLSFEEREKIFENMFSIAFGVIDRCL